MRRKQWQGWIALLFVFAWMSPFQAIAQTTAQSELSQYFLIYGFQMPDDLVEVMRASYEPQCVDCGDVQVMLNEVLYDGRWLYTSAIIQPTVSNKIVVMPGSAQLGDRVCGLYGENQRKDDRSFYQVAVEEDKRLLSVYVYPKEFDQLPAYFIDHLQRADEQSVMLSGACLMASSLPLSIHWSIQIYEVDVKTGAYSLQSEYEYPLSIQPVEPITQKNYKPQIDCELPFDLITLVHTPISTYVDPAWRSEDAYNSFDLEILDNEQHPLLKGAPADTVTYKMDDLPDKIYVKLYRGDVGTWSEPIPLTSIEE